MKQQRLLLATDVPFWRRSTGAEQRIASLVRCLESESIQVRTFFLGVPNSSSWAERDPDLIRNLNLDVECRMSDQPPGQFVNKVGWYVSATLHQFQRWSERIPIRTESVDQPTASPVIEDYRWPWAVTAFKESIGSFQPTAILIEYIKLGYLLDALTSRQASEIHCIVDTHDVLHQRANDFNDFGFPHWIAIDRETESQELKRFDTIVAIQSEEASLFREMAPDCETIVCGHVPKPRLPDQGTLRLLEARGGPDHQDNSGKQVRKWVVGYIGSANHSNVHAIQTFLSQVWTPIQESGVGNRLELVIAGGICEFLVAENVDHSTIKNTRMLGPVDILETFYDSVDIVVNPVEFGTGLKIKNCEAISFGKPLITTEHGWLGMPAALEPGVLVCSSLDSMAELLLALENDQDRFERLRVSAAKLSQTEFSEKQAYFELKQSILRGKPTN